jgi:hypothetical protein
MQDRTLDAIGSMLRRLAHIDKQDLAIAKRSADFLRAGTWSAYG